MQNDKRRTIDGHGLALSGQRIGHRDEGLHFASAQFVGNPGPVHRRQVIYIAGYDPRGPEEAGRRILAREADRMAQRTGITVDITEVKPGPKPHTATWVVRATAPCQSVHQAQATPPIAQSWTTETDFLYLRWDDLVTPDFKRGFVQRAIRSVSTFVDYLMTGTLYRMGQFSHTTLFLWLYPPIAVLLLLMLALLIGGEAQTLASSALGLAPMMALSIGVVTSVSAFALGRLIMPYGYWGHLMELWIFCRDYALGNRPDIQARCLLFAEYIREALGRHDIDETVIVGHSYGGMIAMEATGAAFLKNKNAFAEAAPVTLLNIGSCAGTSLLRHCESETKDRIAAISSTHDLLWIEVQAKQDLINYYQANPATMAGLADNEDQPNPIVRLINLKDTVKPHTYARIRKDFFRNHHQTIMANDLEHPWEFPRDICGPSPYVKIADAMLVKAMMSYKSRVAKKSKKPDLEASNDQAHRPD